MCGIGFFGGDVIREFYYENGLIRFGGVCGY